MDYSFIEISFSVVKNEYKIDSIIDQASGELFSMDDLFCVKNEKTFFIDKLDIFYIYFVNFLCKKNYKCVKNSKIVKQGQFAYSYRAGKCSSIVFNNSVKILFVNFRSKFGVDWQDYAGNDKLLMYAINKGRLGKTLGQDAYNEFLLTRFREKADSNINHKLFRETFPILEKNPDFERAKRNCAGFQFVKKGYYSNVYEFDQSSCYPAQMLNSIPVGEPFEFDELNKVPKCYFKIIRFCYYDIELKPGKIDFLEHSNSGIKVLTDHLFDLFLDNYNARVKIQKIWAFKTRKLLFDKFIKTNIIAGKINENDPIIAKYNKRIANALCGYLGRNVDSFATICHVENNKFYSNNIEVSIDPIYLPAYLYVTGKAKAEFVKTIQSVPGLIYANTDGFLTTQPIEIDRLNLGRVTAVGLYKQKPKYLELYIDCINGYAGTRETGEIDSTIAGLKLDGPISAEQYQSRRFSYSTNMPTDRGTIRVENDTIG